MTFSAVVCVDNYQGVGNSDLGMCWHVPRELKHFKELTIGHPVVMGRKTFEFLGKPLPFRQNIVLTNKKNYSHEGITAIHSIDDIHGLDLINDEVMVIGGLQTWYAFWDKITTIYYSQLYKSYDCCDMYFPDFKKEFHFVASELFPDFVFSLYQR